jgi:hypothetical protein
MSKITHSLTSLMPQWICMDDAIPGHMVKKMLVKGDCYIFTDNEKMATYYAQFIGIVGEYDPDKTFLLNDMIITLLTRNTGDYSPYEDYSVPENQWHDIICKINPSIEYETIRHWIPLEVNFMRPC